MCVSSVIYKDKPIKQYSDMSQRVDTESTMLLLGIITYDKNRCFLSSQTAFSVLNIMKTIQQNIDEGSSYIFITVVCIYHIKSEEIGYY